MGSGEYMCVILRLCARRQCMLATYDYSATHTHTEEVFRDCSTGATLADGAPPECFEQGQEADGTSIDKHRYSMRWADECPVTDSLCPGAPTYTNPGKDACYDMCRIIETLQNILKQDAVCSGSNMCNVCAFQISSARTRPSSCLKPRSSSSVGWSRQRSSSRVHRPTVPGKPTRGTALRGTVAGVTCLPTQNVGRSSQVTWHTIKNARHPPPSLSAPHAY